jgi:predicted unusual protein kinase regulating ubiquinone biosynthesis (AarF/ABC1/UbiB family)
MSVVNYRWSRKNYSAWGRSIDIWRMVLTFSAMIWLDSHDWSYIGGKTPQRLKKRTRARAAWLREALLHLGPTFIKLGQLLSTRADILPVESVEELSKLQDQVPAFGFDQVQEIILQELGRSAQALLDTMEREPIASASLGQVHRARLPHGETVVVKIQRPGLIKLFDIDLGIVKTIAEYFQKHPRYGRGRDWVGIYEECRRILYQEADYLNEGKNADTFRRNFRDNPQIIVPRIYWRYSSRRVLTLEYLPGIKINDYDSLARAGIDRQQLAKLGADSYLQQLLIHGFFHADPHPGNLAVTDDGKLIFYDFGMMGQIPSNTKEKLLQVLWAIARRDAQQVLMSLVDLGAVKLTGDPTPLRRSIQYMLDNFGAEPLEQQSINVIADDLFELAYDQPFRFPASFTFVMRALSTLEGLGKGLDPQFNLMEVAKPYTMELLETVMGNKNQVPSLLLGEFSKQAVQASNSAFNLPRRLEDTLTKIEEGDLRIRVRSQESDRILRRLSALALAGLYAIWGSGFFIGGILLFVHGWGFWGSLTMALVLFCLWKLRETLKRMEKLENMFSS